MACAGQITVWWKQCIGKGEQKVIEDIQGKKPSRFWWGVYQQPISQGKLVLRCILAAPVQIHFFFVGDDIFIKHLLCIITTWMYAYLYLFGFCSQTRESLVPEQVAQCRGRLILTIKR